MNTFKSIWALFKRAFFISLMFVLASCGGSQKSLFQKQYKTDIASDFIDHFEHLAKDYLSSPGVRTKALSKSNKLYLEGLYKRIVLNNELVLTKKIQPKFHIIKSDLPFYFSLPSGRFFMSDNLLKRYLKSENLFASMLSIEIYRVHNNLYEKNVLIPVGYVSTKKMLSLYRIPLPVRIETLKWSYFMLKRSGFDPYSVLAWIQTQNKNSLEFSVQLGTSHSQTREEFLFKNFLVQQIGKVQLESENQEANSSKGFYQLQRSLL